MNITTDIVVMLPMLIASGVLSFYLTRTLTTKVRSPFYFVPNKEDWSIWLSFLAASGCMLGLYVLGIYK